MAEINQVVGNCYLCGKPIRRLEFYAGSTKVVRHIDCPKETEEEGENQK